MCRNFGVCWVDCKDPIDLMDRPLYNEIGLYWYQKATNTKWTYDLTNQLMVELEKNKIVQASMTQIVDLDVMSYIRGMEKSSMTLLMNARVLHYTYDKEFIIIQKYICIVMLMPMCECKSFSYTL